MNSVGEQSHTPRTMRYPEGDPRNRRQWKPWYKRYWIIRGRRREDKIARYVILIGSTLALLPFVFVLASPQQRGTVYLPYVTGAQPDAAAETLDLVNAARAVAGCPPLVPNPHLQQAARDWSEHMAVDDVFAHRDLAELQNRYGYAGTFAGENIAAGYATPAEVVSGWLDSPGHRANILNCRYTESGIGYVLVNPDGGRLQYEYYWTQNFGGTIGNAQQGIAADTVQWNAPEGLVNPQTQAPSP